MFFKKKKKKNRKAWESWKNLTQEIKIRFEFYQKLNWDSIGMNCQGPKVDVG